MSKEAIRAQLRSFFRWLVLAALRARGLLPQESPCDPVVAAYIDAFLDAVDAHRGTAAQGKTGSSCVLDLHLHGMLEERLVLSVQEPRGTWALAREHRLSLNRSFADGIRRLRMAMALDPRASDLQWSLWFVIAAPVRGLPCGGRPGSAPQGWPGAQIQPLCSFSADGVHMACWVEHEVGRGACPPCAQLT